MAAGNAVIGALRAVLGIDTAEFETGLKAASAELASFGAGAAKSAAVIGAAVIAVGSGITIAIQNTINDMDVLSKSSQKLGIPVESLSGLAYAADFAGVSFDSLSKSIAKLSRNAVTGGKWPTESARAFKALGISILDSNNKMKSTDQLMAEVADAFKGINDGAAKTAVAIAIFGKEGANLIPMLNEGGAKLKEMQKRAEEWGAVVGTQAAKNASDFNDNLTDLGYAMKGLFVQVATNILPELVQLSNQIVAMVKNSGLLKTAVEGITKAFNGLIIGLRIVADNFRTLMTLVGIFVAARIISTVISLGVAFVGFARAVYYSGVAMMAFNAARRIGMIGILLLAAGVAAATGQLDKFTGMLKNIKKAIEDALPEDMGQKTIDLLKGLGLNLDALKKDLAAVRKEEEAAANVKKDLNFSIKESRDAIEAYLVSQNKANVAKRNEIATDYLAADSKEALRVEFEALAAGGGKLTAVSEELRAKIAATGKEAGILALQMSNMSLIGEGTTAGFGKMWLAIEATNQKIVEGGMKTEDYARLTAQSLALTQKFWTETADSVAGSIGQMAQTFSKENKTMAMIAKAAGIVQATIAVYTAAAEAYKLGFPAGLAASALVLAKGAALIAAIKGTNVGGMAKGGSFRVPGGMGGGDRVPFTTMLEPGELVEVSSNRSDGHKSGRDSGSNGTRTVYISAGLRQIAEALIPELNAAMRDGHELKLASI